ncbi:type I secretion system permease/ATPase [Ideonella sp. A 288]|uniref:type I secretion system permease/ATPase n=1 Tax=Ideonella sp. A 288 TaxID=1962181 RepID=UPI000B4AF02B|nr:type I secretion system permease/ATPase [Ideonella sp. A 288]
MRWLLTPTTRPFIAMAALASLLLNLALLVPALYMLQVFDRVFSSRSLETLVMLSLFALLALGLAFAMDRARGRLLARASQAVDDALAGPALATALDDAAHGRTAPARLSGMSDVARLRQFLAGPAVQALFDAPWLPVHLLVIHALHPVLGWAAAGSAMLLFALGWASDRLLQQRSAQAGLDAERASRQIDRLLRHAEALQAMAMQAQALLGWQQLHQQAQASQAHLGGLAGTLAALGRALRQAVQVLMLGLGAWLVVAGHASPGIMVATTVLLGRALQPVEHLIAGWRALLDVRRAWRRLGEQPVAPSTLAAPRLPTPRGALQFERVGLLAEGAPAPILKALSLQVAPGECLGLIGPSGAGKTTLLRAALGLRRPQTGAVRLDGLEVSQWPDACWADSVGYLPQDVALFGGTVAQNIARLAPVDTDEALAAVVAAARLAGVHELIMRLPQGYDTVLDDEGHALSGGQRQRIGLARALHGQPRLVVLDEPSAHLDADGEQALATALAALKRAGTTVLLVSHRPALMRHTDTLAVLRDGALVQHGPRDAVLAQLAGHNVTPLRPGATASATPDWPAGTADAAARA